MTVDYQQIQPGWDVYSADGDKIGSISEVSDTYVTLTKGLFLPKDYFIPQDSISRVDPNAASIYLDCSKNELDDLGFDQPPTETSGTTRMTGTTGGREYRTSETATGTGETQRIPRYEEELRAEKSSRQAGEVQVSKDVTEERQGFDVPVTREDVEVRRVAVNRPADGSEEAFAEGDTIRVPVRSEQVEVTKEPRVVEEIEVRRTPRQETQRVEDTVRREQVNVRQSGDVNVRGGESVRDERELAGAGAGADRMQRTDLDAQHDYESAASDMTGDTAKDVDDDTNTGNAATGDPRW